MIGNPTMIGSWQQVHFFYWLNWSGMRRSIGSQSTLFNVFFTALILLADGLACRTSPLPPIFNFHHGWPFSSHLQPYLHHYWLPSPWWHCPIVCTLHFIPDLWRFCFSPKFRFYSPSLLDAIIATVAFHLGHHHMLGLFPIIFDQLYDPPSPALLLVNSTLASSSLVI